MHTGSGFETCGVHSLTFLCVCGGGDGCGFIFVGLPAYP